MLHLFSRRHIFYIFGPDGTGIEVNAFFIHLSVNIISTFINLRKIKFLKSELSIISIIRCFPLQALIKWIPIFFSKLVVLRPYQLHLKETRNSMEKWPLNLWWISNKTIMEVGNITKAATFKSFLHQWLVL